MPATILSPGVYIAEQGGGTPVITGPATTTTVFVGMADRGPFEQPTRVQGLSDYARRFGATSWGEMAGQVRQFFINGGSEAWILRTALNATRASVLLRTPANAGTLRLTARDPGADGNLIRAEVSYATASPEQTFTLRLYRQGLRSDGGPELSDVETHADLSMNPIDPRHAPDVLTRDSALVTATNENPPLAAGPAVSIGGLIHAARLGTARQSVAAGLADGALTIRIGAHPPLTVTFGRPVGGTIEKHVKTTIEAAFAAAGIPVTVNATLKVIGTVGRVLQIATTDGTIAVSPAPGSGAAAALHLGLASGGVEIDSYSARRPAPTGMVSSPGNTTAVPGAGWISGIVNFGSQVRGSIAAFSLTDPDHGAPISGAALGGVANDRIFHDPAVPVGSLNAIRAALDELAGVITGASMRWTAARQGLRLALTPRSGLSEAGLSSVLTTGPGFDLGAAGNIFAIPSPGGGASNVSAYSLGRVGGQGGAGLRQTAGAADEGSDGSAPDPGGYARAFATLEEALPGFNLMVLPRAPGQSDADRGAVWGIASASCARRRAILLVDPDSGWTDPPSAAAGADQVRIGLDARNAVLFWPRLRLDPPGSLVPMTIDPAGTIAGLIVRTDRNEGVWKAPAGLAATLSGATGLAYRMTDAENAVLNGRAVNAIRQFPSGLVSWGARMLAGTEDAGAGDDRYIPVRRTVLFVEESLSRGLQFAVFAPNGEPLWATIRLVVGSFLNGLMRQGAFAGTVPNDCYFVRCDASTTTTADVSLGIVNVLVGIAPLRPAEFIVLTIRQSAGQA